MSVFINVCFLAYLALSFGGGQNTPPIFDEFDDFERAELAKCPCSDAKFCLPVDLQGTGTRDKNASEIFMFAPIEDQDSWKFYDWDLVTTIAFNKNKKLLCYAHERNVKIVINDDFTQVESICDKKTRQDWIQKIYREIVTNFADGVNLDLEKPLSGETAKCYTLLAQELRKELQNHQFTKSAQITVDVAWSPFGVDGRYYDILGLSEATDFMFVMSYDMRSQLYDTCLAGPNTPYDLVKKGLQDYIVGLNIPSHKLVLGLAWYVYFYGCQVYANELDLCSIKEVPFSGAPCSDAGGNQITYADMAALIRKNPESFVERWNAISQTPYYVHATTESPSGMAQLHFDNPKSLKLKYGLVQELNLRGAGAWRSDSLDYVNDYAESMEIWAAMKP